MQICPLSLHLNAAIKIQHLSSQQVDSQFNSCCNLNTKAGYFIQGFQEIVKGNIKREIQSEGKHFQNKCLLPARNATGYRSYASMTLNLPQSVDAAYFFTFPH